MSRLDYDQVDADAMAEHRRSRDYEREPGARRPRRDDRDLNPRRRQQAAMVELANVAATAPPTVERPCPVCLAEVSAPTEPGAIRVDCLECGAALVTRRALDGDIELEAVSDDETVVTHDPDAPAPPLAAGRHLAEFDAGGDPDEPAQTELFPLGGWQRRSFAAINAGMAPRSKKP